MEEGRWSGQVMETSNPIWKLGIGISFSEGSSGHDMHSSRRSQTMEITLFVEDIPEGMDNGELKKLFLRYGVVMDAYIPGKRNKAGKRFGFVRYDCAVAAEVAIQRTNGLWIKDKQLKVKRADFVRR
ncbi:Splicing factor [Dionaea muscipula]